MDEGQYVKAGQLLFKIMPQVYEAELMKSQSEAEVAEIELQNVKMLADKDIVSKSEQKMAQAKLEQARAETKLAQLHLSFTDIIAPFSGIINRIPLKQGGFVDEGALLTQLSDNSQVFAYFNVSEPEYLNYKMSNSKDDQQNVELILANGESLGTSGRVETIESEFDSETGNIAFRARFPNPNGLLKNGETGKIKMRIPLKNALMIPQKATYELQDRIYVFVIDKNNVVRSENIKVAAQLPNLYIVTEGLSSNDKILFEGVQTEKDGQPVRYDLIKPEKAIQSLQLRAE